MVRIIIVSYTKYPDDKGGVPLYNWYLQQAFPKAKRYCFKDFFGDSKAEMPELEKAKLLSKRLVRKGLIFPGDIVIGDGVWGCQGLTSDYYKLISISHGLWYCVRRHDVNIVLAQCLGYEKSKVVIACSLNVVKECKKHYGVESELLLTGLDLEFWKPRNHHQ